MNHAKQGSLFDMAPRTPMATIAQAVADIVASSSRSGAELRFGELFDRVRERNPTAEATDVDLAARPFERWQPDGYRYADAGDGT